MLLARTVLVAFIVKAEFTLLYNVITYLVVQHTTVV
jgi:hypothetical protein